MTATKQDDFLIVVDVPSTLTAEQATVALNEPFNRGYYLVNLCGTSDVRAVYRRRVQVDGEKTAAAEFVRAHPKMTPQQIMAGLAAKGITRSRTWAQRALEDVA